MKFSLNLGFLPLLAALFIALKLTGYVDWGWEIVTLPVWGPLALIVAMIFVWAILAILISLLAALASILR